MANKIEIHANERKSFSSIWFPFHAMTISNEQTNFPMSIQPFK